MCGFRRNPETTDMGLANSRDRNNLVADTSYLGEDYSMRKLPFRPFLFTGAAWMWVAVVLVTSCPGQVA